MTMRMLQSILIFPCLQGMHPVASECTRLVPVSPFELRWISFEFVLDLESFAVDRLL